MEVFSDLKNSFRFWLLTRAHSKVKREGKLLGYNKVISVGIMYDASVEDNYTRITHLVKDFQQEGKKVKTLGYVTQKVMPDYCFPKLTFEFCNFKSFDFFQNPKNQNVKDFISENYDLLLDLTPVNFYQIKHLATTSFSKMKTGIYDEKLVRIYDFMLQVSPEMPFNELVEQVILYLKMINND